jgi:hypothetical protein
MDHHLPLAGTILTIPLRAHVSNFSEQLKEQTESEPEGQTDK